MTTIADALRKVTAAMQDALETGRRSTHVDAFELIEVLLAVADELDPPFANTPRSERGQPTRRTR